MVESSILAGAAAVVIQLISIVGGEWLARTGSPSI
jgi:hypothetical protein